MKLIIAGTRNIHCVHLVSGCFDAALQRMGSAIAVTEIVSGHAPGVDSCGEWLARKRNIPLKIFRADWGKGRAAGPMRNLDMGEYADALLLIWNGISPGSANMKTIMLKREKPVIECMINVHYGEKLHEFATGKKATDTRAVASALPAGYEHPWAHPENDGSDGGLS